MEPRPECLLQAHSSTSSGGACIADGVPSSAGGRGGQALHQHSCGTGGCSKSPAPHSVGGPQTPGLGMGLGCSRKLEALGKRPWV